VEEMPRTWAGWFYFDIDRKGTVVRHIVENVNKQREQENKLKDILARTVAVDGGRVLGEGFGSKNVDSVVPKGRVRVFPPATPSNIYITARPYC
jgi:hypothetical protein